MSLLIRSPKLPIACRPPPDLKAAALVNEIPRGIGVDGERNEQSTPEVSKSNQKQRPTVPPRKAVKQKYQEMERPVPGSHFVFI